MKAALSYILVLSLSLAITLGYYNRVHSQKKTIARLEHNLSVQENSLQYYKTKQGELAAQNSVLEYTISELQKTEQKQIRELSNLGISPRHVSQISTTASAMEYEFSATQYDTLISDSIARAFFMSDRWIQMRGVQQGDTQHISVQIVDTIVQVVYRGKRKKPYLWVFSPRTLQQVIYSKNPHTTIVYNKTIKISKP